jgi:hypothetical protein
VPSSWLDLRDAAPASAVFRLGTELARPIGGGRRLVVRIGDPATRAALVDRAHEAGLSWHVEGVGDRATVRLYLLPARFGGPATVDAFDGDAGSDGWAAGTR